MLESVPTGTVWLPFPATTMRTDSPGRPQTSCEPRWRRISQPASRSASLTSRYFFGTDATVRPEPDAVPPPASVRCDVRDQPLENWLVLIKLFPANSPVQSLAAIVTAPSA